MPPHALAHMNDDDTVIQRLTRLGEARNPIRAMVLTSSRANPDSPRDVLSDHDVILYAMDVTPFIESEIGRAHV